MVWRTKIGTWILTAGAVVALGACGEKNNPGLESGCDVQLAVSYEVQIKPIFAANCETCHRPGGSKSDVQLHTFATAQPLANRSAQRVIEGTMPPPTQPQLSDEERCLVQAWAEQGATQ